VILPPQSFDDLQPLRGARIAVVVLLKLHAILPRFVCPPRRDNIERQSAASANVIDVRGLFCQQRRLMERGTNRNH
jgi:hypothetical protein